MSDIISRRSILDKIKCVCVTGGIFEKPQTEYLKALSKLVENEPSISESDAVKLIWDHNRETLMEQMRKLQTYTLASGRGNMVDLNDVMKVLEGV